MTMHACVNYIHINVIYNSTEATELLHTLDRKYEETLTNKPYRTSKLDRIDGAPSARMPPRGTASWIISSTWQGIN